MTHKVGPKGQVVIPKDLRDVLGIEPGDEVTLAVGEEEFGSRLSGSSGPELKVLHDRKFPRSSANIDHLAVTAEKVWILDAKRYKGKVETRGGGLFSTRPPELYVGGRNQTKLIEGVKRQVEIVCSLLSPLTSELGMTTLPDVRGALVFAHAEFGLFATPFTVDRVWVGWGRAVRKRLGAEAKGRLPVDQVAKRLARELLARVTRCYPASAGEVTS